MFRQQLGGTAEYAASIGKLQIALRGVVGSQAAYDEAIRSAAAATRDLNIPQEEATRGLTRLSAAVIGAGGTVADSSFAFRAMSEAIKATGGNAEQVDGALLALTQVFSKGKVSAEELNQIAERLPGTFTLFAQAAGKTGPELQKALEQGEVGLNDLMKFLALTGERFRGTAAAISSSSQDAGARLTVAFQAMRLEVGNALQPLGAELQETFTAFIKEITPAVVSSAKAIAAAISFFADNKAAAGLATFALQVGAVALALKGLQAASAGLVALNIASWFTGAATGIKITGDAAAVAAPKVGLLRGALGGLVALAAKPIVITIVIAGVIEAIKRIGDVNTAFAEFLKTRKELTGGSWLSSVGGGALSTKELSGLATEVSNAYNFNAAELKRLEQQKSIIELQQNTDATSGAELAALNNRLIAVNTGIETAKKRMTSAKTKLDAIYGQLNAPKPAAAATGTNFPDPTGGEDKDKQARDKAARDAEAAAADQQRLNEEIAKARIALADAVFRNDMELIRKRYEYEQELEGKRRSLLVLSQTGAARGTAELVASYFENMQTLTNRLANAGDVVKTATQGLKSATSLAETTVSTFAAAGGGAIANILPGTRGGPNINEGVGYGRGRLHAGQDLGLDIGDPIHARMAGEVIKAYRTGFGDAGGAVVIRYEDGRQGTYGHTLPSVAQGQMVAAGQRIATVAPDGSNTHLHYELRDALGKLINPINALTASLKVPAGARQATGAAAATRRDVAAEGGAATAAQGLAQAKALQTLEEKQVKDLTALGNQEFVLKYTDALRQQNAALADAATVTALRNKLQLAGERPETIEAEVRKTEETMRARQETEFLTKAIETLTGKGPAAEESANAFRAALAAQNVELANTKTKLDEAAAAQIAFNEAMRTRQDDRIGLGMQEGVQSYLESIGTMRKATEELTVNGIKGVENAIFDLVTTGKTNFREFAADILRQTARMIIQQLVLRQVLLIVKSAFGFADGGAFGGGAADPLGAGGAFWNAKGNAFTGNGVAAYAMGGTFAKNNIIPYAKGGTFTNSIVSKPTLFKFAAGGTMQTGVMGEAGPEAIMPLSRGPNGKLGVASSGGGTTNVTVNVDASGSKAQGDSGKSEQLGRAVSQAVQDELLKQKRPGGLLA
jgi:lambda family phage tail tape measure protein